MAEDGPRLVRPIPRRPFDVNLTSATPPDDDQDESPATSGSRGLDFSSPKFLNAGWGAPESTTSLSRPQSFLNLTSSTLMGIYSEAASSTHRIFNDNDEPDTPWGTGARTPIKRPSIDQAQYELMRDRSHLPRRQSSYGPVDSPPASSGTGSVASAVARVAILFALGLGYGGLVTRLHTEQEQNLPSIAGDSMLKPGNNATYLLLWGVAGVFLGSLLPWVDRVWEETLNMEPSGASSLNDKDPGPGTDWALVMRAIGAFVGIIFAIRKLAWASTLQVSMTLALVNPLLWWLIDRSIPGFLLSAAVGLTGSVCLLGVNPEIMPAPSGIVGRNVSSGYEGNVPVFGGLANKETVESGVWMLSVLFCSCVCFGNIGRRLAWSRSAIARGRWGGVR